MLVSGESTNGALTVITQTCKPGEGPPPHIQENDDEFFFVIEGEFELFDGKQWTKLPRHQCGCKLRGELHTFRNCGTTIGKILCVITPGGLDRYLEAISTLSIPNDLETLMNISGKFGIRFVTTE